MDIVAQAGTLWGMSPPPNPRSLEAIAARLVAIRSRFARSQAAFCQQVGIPPNTWNQYEKAKSRISLDFALRIRDAFQVSLDWIYDGDPSGLPMRLFDDLKLNRP